MCSAWACAVHGHVQCMGMRAVHGHVQCMGMCSAWACTLVITFRACAVHRHVQGMHMHLSHHVEGEIPSREECVQRLVPARG